MILKLKARIQVGRKIRSFRSPYILNVNKVRFLNMNFADKVFSDI